MNKGAYARYRRLVEQLETDPEYLTLEKARGEREPALLAVMECLADEQRAVITDYLGIRAELEQRMLEIACFLGDYCEDE